MSDGELKPGTAIFLRGFKDHPNDDLTLTFGAPKEKGRYHLAVWLGTWKEGEATATRRLNAMGWHFGFAPLLREARDYVVDALDAMEHSSGRDLLNRIDAALKGAEQ